MPDRVVAMAIGTAGFTSVLSIMALEQMGVKPGEHEVIVTGAAGGVGSVAVALLAKLGYKSRNALKAGDDSPAIWRSRNWRR